NTLSPMTIQRILKGIEKFSSLRIPAKVDRHFYEYSTQIGDKVNFAFETPCDEAPQVPKFGTPVAIKQLQRQWLCWNCHGTGRIISGQKHRNWEPCDACGGRGDRQRQIAKS